MKLIERPAGIKAYSPEARELVQLAVISRTSKRKPWQIEKRSVERRTLRINKRGRVVAAFKKERAEKQLQYTDDVVTCRDCGKEFLYDVATKVLLENRGIYKLHRRKSRRCVDCYRAFTNKKRQLEGLGPLKAPQSPIVGAVVNVHDLLKDMIKPALPGFVGLTVKNYNTVYVELRNKEYTIDAITRRSLMLEGLPCKISLPRAACLGPKYIHLLCYEALGQRVKSALAEFGVTEVRIGKYADTLALTMETPEKAQALREKKWMDLLGHPCTFMAESLEPSSSCSSSSSSSSSVGGEEQGEMEE